MGKWGDFIFDNAHGVNAAEVEKKQREKYPHLLHKDERVLLAWKDRGGMGRDKNMFTTHRILMKDGKGITSKRKNYKSIPWWSIQAFSTETAGSMDGDVELRVYSKGIDDLGIDFSSDVVDIFEIQQFMNAKLCEFSTKNKNKGQLDVIDGTPPKMDKKEQKQGIMDWLGDNASQLDPKEVETLLKTQYPVLLQNETVQIAFQSGRDYTVFTDMRVMVVDVKGMSGKRVNFFSCLWKSILAYSVETAGAFIDRDMEMTLFTNIRGIGKIKQDLRHGKCDLFQLQKVLCNHILGEDTKPIQGLDNHEGQVDQKGFWWFRDNQRPLDTVEMNKVYHSNPAILRGNEEIEMAFKGHRDITLFTNLRVILIDPQGFTGKSVEYLSFPWTSITAHGIRTAGKWLDWDAEVMFWTEMDFWKGRAGDDDTPPQPPEPKQSYFELDFNPEKVDMNVLNWYLSHRLVRSRDQMQQGAPIPHEALTTNFDAPGFGLDKLLEKVGGDQREVDPVAINQELHSSTRILMEDETVLMAFKAGRDTSLFTNYRVILIDAKGLLGNKKVEYTSLPFKSIRAWSCETAGSWDTDTELNIYTRNRWHLAKINMDFRTGKADIARINKFFSALIIGLPGDSKVDFGSPNLNSGSREATPIDGKGGLLNNCWEIDAAMMDKKLRSDPNLLLDEEKVLRAFQSGRDVDCYTNRRMITIDTKGLSGKRVKYKSIPWHQVYGYEFETNGPMDRDAEIYLHTEISEVRSLGPPRYVGGLTTKQSLLVKDIDIYEIGAFFNDHVLFAKEEYNDEPEVVMS